MAKTLKGIIVPCQVINRVGTAVHGVPFYNEPVFDPGLKIIDLRPIGNAVAFVVVRLLGVQVAVHPGFIVLAGPVEIRRRSVGPLVEIDFNRHFPTPQMYSSSRRTAGNFMLLISATSGLSAINGREDGTNVPVLIDLSFSKFHDTPHLIIEKNHDLLRSLDINCCQEPLASAT